MNKRILTSLLAVVVGLIMTGSVRAQSIDSVDVSLEDAVLRAIKQSEEVRLARLQADAAQTQVTVARSNLLPQLTGSAGYVRTLASLYDIGGGGMTPVDPFEPDPSLPLEERVKYLEDNTVTAGLGALGSLFSEMPFGMENTYNFGLNGSQVLYAGGRVTSAISMARHAVEAAENNVVEEKADVELQVRTAYLQALLAQELVSISRAAVNQAEQFLDEERLRFNAGRSSDLEVLRAEVDLENLKPQLVQAENASEVSRLNLKRLINVPLEAPIRLSSRLEVPSGTPATYAREEWVARILKRPALLAAEENVYIRQQQIHVARASFLPSVALQTNYGRTLFPTGMFKFDSDWRSDWTVTLGVQIPLFTGFKRSAEVQQARIDLQQAELQVDQLREAIQLQYEQGKGDLERTRVTIGARQRTIEQAQRVYDLTLMRYEKGLATHLEVSNARLALLQARTNLAQALTDYYIAEAGVQRALGTLPFAVSSTLNP